MRGQRRPDHALELPDPQRDRPLERLAPDDLDDCPWRHSELGEVPQTIAIAVADALHAHARAWAHLGQLPQMLFGKRQVTRRDGVTVRIRRRLADRLRHAVDQFVRANVLQTLGFIMNPVPGIPKRFCEIRFDDAMSPDRAKGGTTTLIREPDTSIWLVRDESLLGETTDHSTDRRGRDAENLRDL